VIYDCLDECCNELHDCCRTSLLEELEQEEMVVEQILKDISEGKARYTLPVSTGRVHMLAYVNPRPVDTGVTFNFLTIDLLFVDNRTLT